MLNINRSVNDTGKNDFDPEGYMYDLEHWSPQSAEQMAREEGIKELTGAHWHVIYAMRDLYRKKGSSANAREAMHMLEEEFAIEGGRLYLYELFPKGPVSQGSRLGGVPVPPYASDASDWTG